MKQVVSACALLFALVAHPASGAGPHLWIGGGADTNWSTPENWAGGLVPANDGTADIVFDNPTIGTTTLDVPWSIRSLDIRQHDEDEYTPKITGASLTIGAGGFSHTAGSDITITSPVFLSANQVWSGERIISLQGGVDFGSSNLTVRSEARYRGTFVGDGAIVTEGPQTPIFSGSYLHTGGTIFNAPQTSFIGVTSMGAAHSPVVVNNGVLQFQADSGPTLEFASPLLFSGDSAEIRSHATLMIMNAPIEGSGALRIYGSRTFELQAPMTYHGLVTLSDISLRGSSENLPQQIHMENVYSSLVFKQESDGEYNGSLSGRGTAFKQGSGILKLGGVHNLSSRFYVEEGVLELDGANPALTSMITIAGFNDDAPAVIQYVGGHNLTEELGVGKDFYMNLDAGFSARDGKVTINFFGDARPLAWRDLGPSTLAFGSKTANDITELVNPINIPSLARIQVERGAGGDMAVLSGMISGGGVLEKYGEGTLALTASNDFDGEIRLGGGILKANDAAGLPEDAWLRFHFHGGVLMGDGPTNFLRNVGTQAGDVQWDSASGGFAASGGKMTVTLNGALRLTWGQGGFVPAGKSLILGSHLADAEVEFTNAIQINSGQMIVHVPKGLGGDVARLSGTVTGSGSFVKTGDGKLIVHNITHRGVTIVSEGELSNAGFINGSVVVEAGATASGEGTYLSLDVKSGGAVAPGNSIGKLQSTFAIWQGGGRIELEIANAIGSPGSQWDVWEVSGAGASEISFSSIPGVDDPYVIELVSLGATGPDSIANFDPLQSYAWQFVTAQRIRGFDPSEFLVDASAFQNDLLGGFFGVEQRLGGLFLTFTPGRVPEPATMLPMALVPLALAARSWRRA